VCSFPSSCSFPVPTSFPSPSKAVELKGKKIKYEEVRKRKKTNWSLFLSVYSFSWGESSALSVKANVVMTSQKKWEKKKSFPFD
jgi:hypothetical protein